MPNIKTWRFIYPVMGILIWTKRLNKFEAEISSLDTNQI